MAAAESELLYQNCEAEGDALVLTSRRTAHYGQLRPSNLKKPWSFERQVPSETCRTIYFGWSAGVALGILAHLRLQCNSNLRFRLRHFTTDNFGDDLQNDQKKTPRLSRGTGVLSDAFKQRPMSGRVRFSISFRMTIAWLIKFFHLSSVSCFLLEYVDRDTANVRIVSGSNPLMSGPFARRASQDPYRYAAESLHPQVQPDRDVPACP